MDESKITDSLLYALAISDDEKILLTIFDQGLTATVFLEKTMAVGLAENISRYIQLLK